MTSIPERNLTCGYVDNLWQLTVPEAEQGGWPAPTREPLEKPLNMEKILNTAPPLTVHLGSFSLSLSGVTSVFWDTLFLTLGAFSLALGEAKAHDLPGQLRDLSFTAANLWLSPSPSSLPISEQSVDFVVVKYPQIPSTMLTIFLEGSS